MSTDLNNFGNISNSPSPSGGGSSGSGGGAAMGFKIGAVLFGIMIVGALLYTLFLFDYLSLRLFSPDGF